MEDLTKLPSSPSSQPAASITPNAEVQKTASIEQVKGVIQAAGGLSGEIQSHVEKVLIGDQSDPKKLEDFSKQISANIHQFETQLASLKPSLDTQPQIHLLALNIDKLKKQQTVLSELQKPKVLELAAAKQELLQFAAKIRTDPNAAMEHAQKIVAAIKNAHQSNSPMVQKRLNELKEMVKVLGLSTHKEKMLNSLLPELGGPAFLTGKERLRQKLKNGNEDTLRRVKGIALFQIVRGAVLNEQDSAVTTLLQKYSKVDGSLPKQIKEAHAASALKAVASATMKPERSFSILTWIRGSSAVLKGLYSTLEDVTTPRKKIYVQMESIANKRFAAGNLEKKTFSTIFEAELSTLDSQIERVQRELDTIDQATANALMRMKDEKISSSKGYEQLTSLAKTLRAQLTTLTAQKDALKDTFTQEVSDAIQLRKEAIHNLPSIATKLGGFDLFRAEQNVRGFDKHVAEAKGSAIEAVLREKGLLESVIADRAPTLLKLDKSQVKLLERVNKGEPLDGNDTGKLGLVLAKLLMQARRDTPENRMRTVLSVESALIALGGENARTLSLEDSGTRLSDLFKAYKEDSQIRQIRENPELIRAVHARRAAWQALKTAGEDPVAFFKAGQNHNILKEATKNVTDSTVLEEADLVGQELNAASRALFKESSKDLNKEMMRVIWLKKTGASDEDFHKAIQSTELMLKTAGDKGVDATLRLAYETAASGQTIGARAKALEADIRTLLTGERPGVGEAQRARRASFTVTAEALVRAQDRLLELKKFSDVDNVQAGPSYVMAQGLFQSIQNATSESLMILSKDERAALSTPQKDSSSLRTAVAKLVGQALWAVDLRDRLLALQTLKGLTALQSLPAYVPLFSALKAGESLEALSGHPALAPAVLPQEIKPPSDPQHDTPFQKEFRLLVKGIGELVGSQESRLKQMQSIHRVVVQPDFLDKFDGQDRELMERLGHNLHDIVELEQQFKRDLAKLMESYSKAPMSPEQAADLAGKIATLYMGEAYKTYLKVAGEMAADGAKLSEALQSSQFAKIESWFGDRVKAGGYGSQLLAEAGPPNGMLTTSNFGLAAIAAQAPIRVGMPFNEILKHLQEKDRGPVQRFLDLHNEGMDQVNLQAKEQQFKDRIVELARTIQKSAKAILKSGHSPIVEWITLNSEVSSTSPLRNDLMRIRQPLFAKDQTELLNKLKGPSARAEASKADRREFNTLLAKEMVLAAETTGADAEVHASNVRSLLEVAEEPHSGRMGLTTNKKSPKEWAMDPEKGFGYIYTTLAKKFPPSAASVPSSTTETAATTQTSSPTPSAAPTSANVVRPPAGMKPPPPSTAKPTEPITEAARPSTAGAEKGLSHEEQRLFALTAGFSEKISKLKESSGTEALVNRAIRLRDELDQTIKANPGLRMAGELKGQLKNVINLRESQEETQLLADVAIKGLAVVTSDAGRAEFMDALSKRLYGFVREGAQPTKESFDQTKQLLQRLPGQSQLSQWAKDNGYQLGDLVIRFGDVAKDKGFAPSSTTSAAAQAKATTPQWKTTGPKPQPSTTPTTTSSQPASAAKVPPKQVDVNKFLADMTRLENAFSRNETRVDKKGEALLSMWITLKRDFAVLSQTIPKPLADNLTSQLNLYQRLEEETPQEKALASNILGGGGVVGRPISGKTTEQKIFMSLVIKRLFQAVDNPTAQTLNAAREIMEKVSPQMKPGFLRMAAEAGFSGVEELEGRFLAIDKQYMERKNVSGALNEVFTVATTRLHNYAKLTSLFTSEEFQSIFPETQRPLIVRYGESFKQALDKESRISEELKKIGDRTVGNGDDEILRRVRDAVMIYRDQEFQPYVDLMKSMRFEFEQLQKVLAPLLDFKGDEELKARFKDLSVVRNLFVGSMDPLTALGQTGITAILAQASLRIMLPIEELSKRLAKFESTDQKQLLASAQTNVNTVLVSLKAQMADLNRAT